MIRTASWGCGLQSTTMIAMSVLGDLPILDHVIFCDLGWERAETYATLDWYTEFIEEAGVPVHVLRTGNIRKRGAEAHIHMPFWTDLGGHLRRQCTRNYKIRPTRRHLRTLLGLHPTLPPNPQPNSVEQWIGITTDEHQRARASEVDYITNRYPLLQAGMSRNDCGRYLYEHGLPIPPKSACI
ncbi:MAG: phosphoadenosine phosphosulfate reductase family protein, partial [Anaerolineae bacterium]